MNRRIEYGRSNWVTDLYQGRGQAILIGHWVCVASMLLMLFAKVTETHFVSRETVDLVNVIMPVLLFLIPAVIGCRALGDVH